MSNRLSDELRGLFAQVTDTRQPEAAELRAYYEARGFSLQLPGPNLERPAWSTVVAPEDVFVEIGSDAVAGVRFGDDPRGYGAYVEIAVKSGTLQEVEAITGPLSPRRAAATSPYEVVFARAVVRGYRIPVNVAHDNGAVKSVSVQFERNAG